jgi:hypothetical protein
MMHLGAMMIDHTTSSPCCNVLREPTNQRSSYGVDGLSTIGTLVYDDASSCHDDSTTSSPCRNVASWTNKPKIIICDGWSSDMDRLCTTSILIYDDASSCHDDRTTSSPCRSVASWTNKPYIILCDGWSSDVQSLYYMHNFNEQVMRYDKCINH